MANVTYEILDENLNSFQDIEKFSDKDLSLIKNFTINKGYDFNNHYIETHFYSTNNVRLFSSYEYKLPTPNLTPDGELSTEVTVDPASIAREFGFTRTDIKILFHFLNDLFTSSKQKKELYIQQISKDRTEILLYSEKLTTNEIINKTEELKIKLEAESYFDEFLLNLGENDLFIVTNIDSWELDNKFTIALKLYEPLPDKYELKDKAQLVRKVADSVAVKVLANITVDPPVVPKLRGPNFTAKTSESESEPTQYFNFDDLFSFSNTNSNRQLFSTVRDRSIDLGIDYSSYENYLHFSSAEERLKNFKYKVQLLETYQADLDTEQGLSNSSTAATSGSIEATKNLIEGIVNNFDHYERYLYFESGSTNWPKSNTLKPFVNFHSTSSNAIDWYNQQLTSASNYDVRNYDLLTNFLPEYLTDDTNNAKGVLFTHMIGQHFDNLWIYTKAITDKYDTDHRLNMGISKDLVQEAVKSLGIKIHNSKEGSNDLFKYFINDSYDSGSIGEVVNTFNSSGRPTVSNKDYEAEVYKRIYHNIPLLLKSKGTKRGLRALINCFGIPSDFLKIKTFGGEPFNKRRYLGPDFEVSDQLTKITHSSGSTDGYVLTQNTSIFKQDEVTAPDQHRLEVGFSPANAINALITSSLGNPFNIDDFIGDPRDLYDSSYNEVYPFFGSTTLQDYRQGVLFQNTAGYPYLDPPNLKDFVRSFKFYDNVLFKMIKDFVPARVSLDTGIIIKPHLLERNKIKSPSLSGENETYSGSMETAFMTGSSAGAYNDLIISADGFQESRLKHIEAPWPGTIGGHSDLQFRVNFRTDIERGDDGEIIVEGNDFYHPNGAYFNIREVQNSVNPPRSKLIGTPYENGNIAGNTTGEFDFYVMHTSQSRIQRFPTLTNGNGGSLSSWHHNHLIAIDYSPHGQNSWVARGNSPANSASFAPISSDVILAAFTHSGSNAEPSFGINTERFRFYNSLSGYVMNTPSNASTEIVMAPTTGSAVLGVVTIVSTSGNKEDFHGTTGTPLQSYGGGVTFKSNVSSAQRVLALQAAITANPSDIKNDFKFSYKTTFETNDTLVLHQKIAGTAGNTKLTAYSQAYQNILSTSFPPKDFTGGADNFKTYGRINDTTFYSEVIETKSGSINKLIGDESPKFNGELSGSKILLSDGELNRENPFKKVVHPRTLFHITTVNQTITDTLTPVYVMNTGVNPIEYNSAVQACAAFNLSSAATFYHGGSNLVPAEGDILYTDINGLNPVTSVEQGDHTSFAINNNGTYTSYTAAVSASNNPGQLYNIVACGTLDTTAPSGYTAAWTNSTINAQNVSSVPFEVRGTIEPNSIMFATASDQSGNKAYKVVATGGANVSTTMNTTNLDDGENVTIDVKLRDAAGNEGASASAHTGAGFFGLTINKQVAGPTGYSIEGNSFRIVEHSTSFGQSPPTQSSNYTGKYRLQVHYDVNFSGNINYNASGSHASTGVIQSSIPIVSGTLPFPGTASIFITDDNSAYGTSNYLISNTGSGTWNNTAAGNTVNAFVWLTDANGNSGDTVSASVSYYPYIFQHWDSGSNPVTSYTVPYGGSSDSFSIVSRGSAATAYVSTNPPTSSWNWGSLITGDFGTVDAIYGNSTEHISLNQNTGAARQLQVNIQRSDVQDNFTYVFSNLAGGNFSSMMITQQTNSQCLDPNVSVLMKTGNQKLAKDLKVGDVIRSKHELSKELLEDIIIQIVPSTGAEKLKLIFDDETDLIASIKHRVYLDSTDDFVAIDTLKVGDIISGKTIEMVEEYETGDVIKITTEKTHTYISNGVLSHNGK